MTDAHDPKTGEVMDSKSTAAGALTLVPEAQLAVRLAREELQVQLDQAGARPRSVHKVVDRINTLATLDDESAASCIYSIPRDGKVIEGPSIRMAEIVASQWGNNTYAGRVTDIGDKFIEAEGVHYDLETNSRVVKRVQRRITTSNGRRYGDDMIGVTGNAAISISLRNAVLAAVPRGVWMPAFLRVRQVVMGEVTTLANRRAAAVEAFTRFGVTAEQVCIALGVEGVKDITLEMMVPIAGMFSALNSGEADPSELFAAVEKPTARAKRLSEAHGKDPRETKSAAGATKTAESATDSAQAATKTEDQATVRPTETGGVQSAAATQDTSGSAEDASTTSQAETSGGQQSAATSSASETRRTSPAEVKKAVDAIHNADSVEQERTAAAEAGKTQPEDPALASQGGAAGDDLFSGDAPSPKDKAKARAAEQKSQEDAPGPEVTNPLAPGLAKAEGCYHLSTDRPTRFGQLPYYDLDGEVRGHCGESAGLPVYDPDELAEVRARVEAESTADPHQDAAEDDADGSAEDTFSHESEGTRAAGPFEVFSAALTKAVAWADIKAGFLALAGTEEFKTAGAARWREASVEAWNRAEELMREGDETLDYTRDMLAFRLYVEAAKSSAMINGAWLRVSQGEAYRGLPDNQKTQLGRTVATRIDELNKA